MIDLYAIDPKQTDMFWEPVRPFVETAMAESSRDTPEEVYAALKDERALLWIVWHDGEIEAVVVTQLELTAKGKICGIWVCTGKGRENWDHLLSKIEDYAKREGCAAMRHSARPGWSRVLKPRGYECTHHILEKAL